KPQIDYVCVTERQDWDSGGFNDKECSPNGSKGNGTQGDIRARTGDILTIVGRNFQRSNEAPVCLSATDCSPRKRIPLDVEVVVGGVHVADGVASKFALVNGLKSDLRNGECTNDNEAGGGICQRIHVVVPKIPAQKIPLFVGAAVQNKTLDRDEYGGQPALGVSGDPGDRKIKYYGGVGPTDPVDTTPPPPVRIVQALAGGTDSIEVSFEEVGDDPAGLPNAGLPVRNYVLKRASSPISSETDFSNSFAFQPDPAGHDPSVGDAFGHLPPWQTLSFTGLAPRSTYCFSAKAVDRSGNISLLRVPAGDGGPDGVFCATTDDIPRPNTPPCPIVLAAEKGDDPTHQIRLNWVEVRENGWDVTSRSCVNPDGGPVAELVLKYKEGPVDFPSDQFGDKIDNPLGLILHDQEDDGTVPLYSRPPGDNHSVQVSGLQSGSSYIFAIRSKDAEGLPSEVSGHVAYATDPIVTPTPVGNSEFVDLSSNLPRTTNVENSLHILPSVWDGQPWVLLADPSAGIQIFKVADDDNVSCKKQDGTFDTACIFTPDDFPKDTQTPPRWVGDLQRDFLDRDRHVLRTGAGFDCDGLDAVQQIPSNVDWTKVDTFTRCNLPRHPVYGADLNKASMVAVGDVNGDEHEDLVIANHSANQVPDAAFINSGYDLCNRPGRTDVADGIPCFLSPVTLPSQLAGDKRPSSRVRLYDAVEGDGGADLIFVLTGQMEIGGLSVYENRCKNRPLQNCQSNDFVLRTDLIDVGGDERLLPVYCEDVAFVDLDGDESRDRDMICVRSESFTTPDNHGVNLTFEAISPSESPDGLPHFRLNRNLLSAATANNCNHSFGESAKGTNGQDYLAIGYRKLGGSAAGQGTSCRTRLFAGDGGGLAEALLPGMSNQDNCHNGALADTRGLGRMDFAAACGQLEDLSSDFGGNPEFRGMKILLNGGVNLGVDGFDLGMNVFEDFEAAGLRLFRSAVDSAGRPTLLPGPPRIFQDVDDPGAATAVGIGDLNRDGVPDIYFGNGATSVGGSALDRVFRQMKR
ncbi:MAG TPA: hypothetical protein VI895_12835, partial [Bdellovibrionota bacterium]|nr:hypothetical protein [Bdellovibrionota bacterium]